MMKFPYELSEQRISLLSKEDLALYRYEHSDYYSADEKEKSYNILREAHNISHYNWLKQLDENEEFNDLNDAEKVDLANELANAEMDEDLEMLIEMAKEDLKNIYSSDEEFENGMNEIREWYKLQYMDEQLLDEEALGPDMTAWAKGLSPVLVSVLGLGFAGLVGLIAAGKDKLALKSLEKYMNKLVEMTDDGINKKKSFWANLGSIFDRKNSGDKSSACFRDLQETCQRNQLKSILVLEKQCGYLGADPLAEASSQNFTGGLFTKEGFKGNISDKIDAFMK